MILSSLKWQVLFPFLYLKVLLLKNVINVVNETKKLYLFFLSLKKSENMNLIVRNLRCDFELSSQMLIFTHVFLHKLSNNLSLNHFLNIAKAIFIFIVMKSLLQADFPMLICVPSTQLYSTTVCHSTDVELMNSLSRVKAFSTSSHQNAFAFIFIVVNT